MNDLVQRLLEADHDLFLRIQGGLHDLTRREPEFGTALRAANEFGSGWMFVPVLIGIVALERSFPRALRRLTELGLAAFAAGYGAYVLKRAIGRPRPQTVLADAFRDGDAVVGFGEVIRGASFPSGHAASAFAVALVFAFWAGAIPSAWRRRAVRAALFAVALLTGVARIYGGAHFPLDVLAGALLGVACGGVVVLLSRRGLGPWTEPRVQPDPGTNGR